MNFEAVPCMLRTSNDGSSVYGLLIRPSQGNNNQQQQPVQTGAGKAMQLVPSAVLSTTNVQQKVLIPSLTPHSTVPVPAKPQKSPNATSWQPGPQTQHVPPCVGTASSSTFDSPSPSQVVPQLTNSEVYEPSSSTASSNSTGNGSFFPPISAIANSSKQHSNTSSSFSNYLDDLDLSSTNFTDTNYIQQHQQQQQHHQQQQHQQERFQQQAMFNQIPQYDNTTARMQPLNIHVIEGNLHQVSSTSSSCNNNNHGYPTVQQLPPCRFNQSEQQMPVQWAPQANTGGTPDSGIQSFAGSSPDSYTPPVVSPALRSQMIIGMEIRNDHRREEFDDMPVLQPYATEEEDEPETINDRLRCHDDLSQRPSDHQHRPSDQHHRPSEAMVNDKMFSLNERFNRVCEHSDALGRRDSPAGWSETRIIDPNQLVEHVLSSLDVDQIKQFTSLIQQKAQIVEKTAPSRSVDSPINNAIKSPLTEPSAVSNVVSTPPPPPLPLPIVSSSPIREKTEDEKQIENEKRLRNLQQYREKVKRRLSLQLENIVNKINVRLDQLHLHLNNKRRRPRSPHFAVDWKCILKKLEERRLMSSRDKDEAGLESEELDDDVEPDISSASRLRRKRKRRDPWDRKQKRSRRRDVDDQQPSTSSIDVGDDQDSTSGSSSFDSSLDYIKIRTNVLLEAPSRIDHPICECRNNCGSSCINRLTYVECNSQCRSIDCSNRRFNRPVNCVAFDTGDVRGMGVRCKEALTAGQFVCEYVGEVVSVDRFNERMSTAYRNCRHHYALNLGNGFVIDSYRRGNLSRFINHSCQPNCHMQKWLVNGHFRMGLFALKDIESGQELSYDYKFDSFDDGQRCFCGASRCRRSIRGPSWRFHLQLSRARMPTRNLSGKEREFVQRRRIFLTRLYSRLHKMPRKIESRSHSSSSNVLGDIAEQLLIACRAEQFKSRQLRHVRAIRNKAVSGELTMIDEFEQAMNEAIRRLGKSTGSPSRKIDQLLAVLATALKKNNSELNEVKSNRKTKKSTRRSEGQQQQQHRGSLLSIRADLSYMDSAWPVGSYDPDDGVDFWKAEADRSDCMRCICGTVEEDGTMLQCDRCRFWLHADCLDPVPIEDQEFTCKFCLDGLNRTPLSDVILRPQPAMRLDGCKYFRSLVNSRGMQIRVNETVYVQRLIDDQHKATLKQLHAQCVTKLSSTNDESAQTMVESSSIAVEQRFSRRDLRSFRVERLFTGPRGERFVFGCYYARPHETFCDPSRCFYSNELFWTPFFDTLPLEAVVGRCLVLDPSTWAIGRPRMPHYREEDVFVCEYQIDRHQRSFEKTRNHYYVNTEPYIFQRFDHPLSQKRDFTPFVLADRTIKKDGENIAKKPSKGERLHALIARLIEG